MLLRVKRERPERSMTVLPINQPKVTKASYRCKECGLYWRHEELRCARMDMLDIRPEEEHTIWLKCVEHTETGQPRLQVD